MPRYVIEREVPDAGKLSPRELHEISRKSAGVLSQMGPDIQWLHSYVSDDKIYCVYVAPSEERIREHAERCEIPANRISVVRNVIDPVTAEERTEG